MRPLRFAQALALVLATLAPQGAWTAGSETPAPPEPTETTTKCEKGLIWDPKSQSCRPAEDAALSDDLRFNAAREFAYFGQPRAALRALAAMQEGDSDRVLTYRAFAERQRGHRKAAFALYARALQQNPDNLLARSYLGQAYVAQGDLRRAKVQLVEIQARGGKGSWPEVALAKALRTGAVYSH